MAIDKVKVRVKAPDGVESSTIEYSPTQAELDSGKAIFRLWRDLIPDGIPGAESDLPISLGTAPINKPPVILGEEDFFGKPNKEITISQDFSDPENDPLVVSWIQVSGDKVNFVVSGDKKSITFTPTQVDEIRFDLEVNDGVNAVHKLIRVFINENQPPVVILPSEVDGLLNKEVRITGSVSDLDGTITEIEWTQPPTQIVDFRVSPDHLTLSFTPDRIKQYMFHLSAVDNEGAETTKTVFVNVTDQPPQPVEIPIIAVRASKQDLNKTAEMAIDGNFESRWSADGKDEWWEADLDAVWKIDRIEITGFHYDREYYFQIEGDSKIYTVPANRAPNTLIPFDLKDRNLSVSKIRVIGQGNQNSTYNSYREIKFFGVKVGDIPNQPPKIEVPEAINTTVGTATTITAKISDIDGTIHDVLWSQISGTDIPFTVSADQQSITFTPQSVGSVSFKVEAIDDDLDLTSKTIVVTITEKATSFKIEAFADTDVGNNPESVLDAIFREKDVEAWIFGGDGPYASRGTSWVNMMKKYFTPDIVEDLIISQGNHEHPESETQQAEVDIEAWRPELNQSPEGMDWLSAKQINNVYIISMNSQDEDIAIKGVQYNWVLGELQKAKALRDSGQIDWIFAVVHKPWFTLKTSHSAYTAARNNFTDIFKEYGVDVVIHGHNHNTQIWEPMIADKNQSGNGDGISLFTKTPDGAYDFSKEHGWLTVITGHGGHEHNGISNSDPKVLFFNDEDFGFTEFVISGKEIVVNAKDTQNKVMFTCKLVRGGASNPNIPQLNVSFPANLSVGQQGTVDASNSVADTITTTVTSGQNVNLTETSKWKWNLTPPDIGQQSYQLALQTIAQKGTGQAIKQIAIQVSKQTTGETDEHGTKLLYKVTGKRVEMEEGSDHRNGKRYNVNHKFVNYMMYGFFRTGRGQEKLEMKSDGPNHGGCDKLPQCMWYEPSIVVDTGVAELGGEWPHPDNHNNLPTDFVDKLAHPIKEQWVGYAIVGYTNSRGNRVIEQWDMVDPFGADGKPKNNWHLNLKVEDTKGKVFPSQYHPRMPPINFDEGLEAEIRMHRATSGDTEMKWTYVAEIIPPS